MSVRCDETGANDNPAWLLWGAALLHRMKCATHQGGDQTDEVSVARMSDPSHPSSGRFRLIPPDCGKPSKFGLFRFSRLPAGAIVFRLLPPRSVMEPGDKPGDENANVGPAFRHLRAWPEAVGEVLRRRRSDVTGDAHQDQGHRHQSLAIPLSDRQPRAVYGARLGADRPSSGGARQGE